MARKMRRSTEIDEVDDWYETMLRSGPLPGDDAAEALCNAVLHQINQYRAGEGGDEIDAEIMLPELRTAIIIMVHGGRDPSRVPYRHVRHALDNPVSIRVREYRGEWKTETAINDYPAKVREAIDGPLRAIRTWCIGCQGGDLNLVRACPSVNCFLWSFRMQSNPFYGRLKAGDNDDEEDGFEGDAVMAEADEDFEAEERQRFAELGNK